LCVYAAIKCCKYMTEEKPQEVVIEV